MNSKASQFAGNSIVSSEVYPSLQEKNNITSIFVCAGKPPLTCRLPALVTSGGKIVDVIPSSCKRDPKKLGVHILLELFSAQSRLFNGCKTKQNLHEMGEK